VRATLDDPALSYFNFQEPRLSGQLHAAETKPVHGEITAEIENAAFNVGLVVRCGFHNLVL